MATYVNSSLSRREAHDAGQPRRAPFFLLLVVAVAMELLYLRILSLGDLKKNVVEFILLGLVLGVLYLAAVYLAERIVPNRSRLLLLVSAAVLFRLTLLPLYPSLSDDLYRYRWEGRAQLAGYNPYTTRPDDPKLSFLLEKQHPAVSGPEYGTLYGPVIEEISWLSSTLLPNVIATKVPFLLCDLATIWVLLGMLAAMGTSPMLAIVYAWSPLVVVEFAASGHNDSVPILAFVIALLYYQKQRERLSIAALSVSALSKLYTGFTFPIFLARTRWRWIWIPAAMAIAAFLPYGSGWLALLHTTSRYGTIWKNNQSLFRVIHVLGISDTQAERMFLVIVAAVIFYCVIRKLQPARSSYLIIGAILIFSPNVFPWYLTWIVPLLAIYPNRAWLLLTVTAFLSYHVLIPYGVLGLWRENRSFILLEYVPFYVLLLGDYALRRLDRLRTWSEPPSPTAAPPERAMADSV